MFIIFVMSIPVRTVLM